MHPISLCLISVSLFLLIAFICRSRTATLSFANDHVTVREEQRGASRTANKNAVLKRGIGYMKSGFGIEVACKATSRKLMCGASTEAEGPVSPQNPVMPGDLEKN
jgi:hypothetical protein